MWQHQSGFSAFKEWSSAGPIEGRNMAIKWNDLGKSRLWNAVNRANIGVPTEGAQRPSSARNALRNDRFRLESLEPRLLLSADPVFAAAANADLTVRLLQEDDVTLVQILDNTADSEDSAVLQEYTLIDDTGSTVLNSLTINGVDGSDESLTLENSILDDTTGLLINFDGGTGGSDGDTVTGTSADTAWNLTGSGSGNAGSLSFSGVDNIAGGEGSDTVVNAAGTSSWSLTDTYSGSVQGVSFTGVENLSGTAGDTLDYSAYGIGVTVDLSAGVATGFASVTGFDHVTGSAHDDIIAGNSNSNTLAGGGGTDTLVVTRDADITLSDSEVRFGSEAVGSGEDTISGFEAAELTGGDSGNVINASLFTGTGGVTIDGGAGDDTLTGTANADSIKGGLGSDTIDGLGGSDTVVVSRDVNIELTDTKIIIDSVDEDTLSNIETASLTGGDSANTITAATFSKGGVTIDGGSGADNITGSAQADLITGGLGADIIDGLGGTDTLVESSNGHFALVGAAASSALTSSKNETALVTLTGVTGGTFTLTFDGQTTAALAHNASVAEIKAALRNLSNIGERDIAVSLGDMDVSTDPVDGTTQWTITFTGDLANSDVADLTLDDTSLVGGTASLAISQYFAEDDTITNVEQAELTTGQGANIMDASGFSGSVTLDAGSGDDILRGGSAADILKGGSGSDILSGGAGEDNIDGGTGNDILSESGDRNFYLTSASLLNASNAATSTEDDTLSGIEGAELTGGAGANTIDASGFSNVDATTQLYYLNNGFGVGTGVGNDLLIKLGTTSIEIDLSTANTIQDVLDQITAADASLTAVLDGIAIKVTSSGDAITEISSLNDTSTAKDLGLTFSGSSASVTGETLGTGSVILSGGAGADTITGSGGADQISGGLGADVIDGNGGQDHLIETFDLNMTLSDAAPAGAHDAELVIGADAADELTSIEQITLTGGASDNTLDASGYTLSSVTLATGGGKDTLKGGDKDDIFIIDPTGLIAGTDKVTIDVGGGSANEVKVLDSDGLVTQADFGWVTFSGANAGTQTLSSNSKLTVSEDISLDGTSIKLLADTIEIKGYTIDTTSNVAGGVSGDIILEGINITIDEGAQLIAKNNTSSSGNISILALDDRQDWTSGFANIDFIEATVTIGENLSGTGEKTILKGADVTIYARADAQHYLKDTDQWDFSLSDYVAFGAESLIGATENFAAFVAVSYAKGNAKVKIGKETEVEAEDFVADATSVVNVSASPIGWAFAGAAGVIDNTAKVEVEGKITTTDDLIIRSTADSTTDVLADPTAAGTIAVAVGISVLDSESTAHVKDTAILSVGGDLTVDANSVERNRTMARAISGNDGALGVALAFSYETSDTNAYLDGTVSQSDTVSVTAEMEKAAIESTNMVVVPTIVNGVQAVSANGSESKGNLLEDTEATAKEKMTAGVDKLTGGLITKVSNAVAGVFTSDPPADPWKFDASFSTAVVIDRNRADARIGDGTNGDVTSTGDITVQAKVESRPDVTATSSAADENASDPSKGPQANKGGSVAIAVGVFENDADAFINSNAKVDTAGTLTVDSQALNKIDPLGLWGANLIAPLIDSNSIEADYNTTEDYAQPIKLKGVVEVKQGHTAGGNVGSFYEYTGDFVENYDLSTTDFSSGNWKEINPVADKATNFLGQLTTYLDDNLGLDNNLIDSWTVATAEGQKLSIAGAGTAMFIEQDSDARIKSGAEINQRLKSSGTPGDVVVTAASVNHLAALGGNFKTPGIASGNTTGSGADKQRTWKPSWESGGAGSSSADGGSAAGLTVLYHGFTGNSTAKIEDGVLLDADALKVSADNQTVGVTLGASGGQSDNIAFNGAVIFSSIVNETVAQVSEGATINVGSGDIGGSGPSMQVKANDDAYLITVAGGIASSEHVGVGAAVSGNFIDRQTEALIGARSGEAVAASLGSVTVGGDLSLEATHGGFVGSLAISGAKTSSSNTPENAGSGMNQNTSDGSSSSTDDPGKLPNNQKNYDNVIAELKARFGESSGSGSSGSGSTASENAGKSGYGISGSVTINYVNDDVWAYIDSSGDVTASSGTITIKSEDTTAIGSLAGSAAISSASAGKSATGIAGAIGINLVGGKSAAYIDNAGVITTSRLDMDASRTGWVVSINVGVAGATGQQGTAVGGSVAVTRITYSTETSITNTPTVVVNGLLSMHADDSSNLILVAGAGGFGGKSGAGVSVAFSEIENSVTSKIDNVGSLKYTGGLDVNAKADGLLVAVTGTVGVSTSSTGGLSLAGTLSINMVDTDVDAAVLNTTTTSDSAGNVTISALDDSSIFSFAGGFAAGGKAGLGAALALNFMTNTVKARVEGSTLRTDGNVTVKALESSSLIGISLGGAGTNKLAIGAAVSANQTANTVSATVSNSTIEGRGNNTSTSVIAQDSSTSVGIAGAGAGAGKVALGASIGVNLIGNTITSEVDNSLIRMTGSGSNINVTATAEETLVSVAIGGAGAGKFALGGSVSVNEITNTVEAKVTNSKDSSATSTPNKGLHATGDISVAASDSTTMVVVSGAGAGAGTAAIGAAVSTTDVGNTIKAYVDGSTVNSSAGNVSVTAGFAPPTTAADLASLGVDTADLPSETDTSAQIINVTVAGAGANTFAAGAAISLNWLHNNVQAYISGGADVDATGDIKVNARDDAEMTTVAVGAAGAGTTAIGAALAYNYIGGTPSDPSRTIDSSRLSDDAGEVLAYIDNSQVDSSAAGVEVAAHADASIINVTIGAAGAGTVAVAGSVSINFMRNIVDASIKGGADVTASTDVDVSATVTPIMIIVAGGGSGAGTAAGSIASATNDMRSSISASIEGSGTTATAQTGSVNVAAEVLNTNQLPTIGDGSSATQADTYAANAADPTENPDPILDAQIWSFAVSGAGAGTAAGAGALSLNWIRNEVEAFIADNATVTANSGGVSLRASDQATLNSLAAGMSGAGTAAVGAAVAYNYIGGDPDDPASTRKNFAKVYIDNATVNTGTLAMNAIANANINSLSVGLSGAGTFAGSGALSLNWIKKNVEATITNGAQVTTTGSVTVRATDTSTIRSAAVVIAGSGTAAVGGAVAYNEIANNISAGVSGSGTTVSITSGNSNDIVIESLSDSTVKTLVASVAGSGAASVAGSAGANLLENQVNAFIDTATVTTDGSISVYAESKDTSEGIVGSIGASGTAGIGGAVTVNQLDNGTYAYIDNATVVAKGLGNGVEVKPTANAGSTDTVNGVSVRSNVATNLESYAGAGGVSGTVGLAANVLVNRVANTSEARVKNSTINNSTDRGKHLKVNAHQQTDFVSGGGAAGVGLAGGGAAATVDTNFITNTTRAYVDGSNNSKDIYAADGISVNATSDENLSTVAVSVGGGLYVGASGTASAFKSSSLTEAYVSDADLISDGAITISADSDVDMSFVDTSIALGAAGAGASVSVALFDGTTKAYTTQSSTLTTTGSVSVLATSKETSDAFIGAGAGGLGSLAASVGVLSSTSHTSAALGASTTVNASAVTVDAENTINVNKEAASLVGSASVGGGGAGASVDVITINNTVDAHIGDNSVITTAGAVRVDAKSTRNVESNVVGFAGGAGLAISGAVSYISIGSAPDSENNGELDSSQDNITDAFGNGTVSGLSGDSNDSSAQRAQAKADSTTYSTDIKTSVSNGYSTQAYIGDNVTIQGDAASVTVKADETVNLDVLAGGLAASGGVSVGGTVSIATMDADTKAYIGNGGTISTTGDVTVDADYTSNVTTKVYGGSAGVVGLGAQVAIVKDSSNQSAYVENGTSDSNGAKFVKADDIIIDAKADRNIDIDIVGVSVGTAAAGAAVGDVSVSGSTTALMGNYAQVGQSTGNVDSLTVNAASELDVDLDVTAVAAGLGAGSGNDANISFTPIVRAAIGAGADVTVAEGVTVNAVVTPEIETDMLGVSAGGLTVGVSLTDVDVTPIVSASLGSADASSGNVSITANTLNVTASTAVKSGGDGIKAESTGSSGSLVGVNATLSELTTSSNVQSVIGNNSTLNVAGVTTITATTNTRQNAESNSNTGGIVAAGASVAKANSNTTTNAYVGSGVTVNAGSLNLASTATDDNFAYSNAGSGGVLAGAGAQTQTNNFSTTTATIGNNASITLGATSGTGELDIKAEHIAKFNSEIDAVAGGVLSGAGAETDHYVTADVSTTVGNNATIVAKDIDADALNRVRKDWLSSGANINGTTGGVASGAGADSDTTLDMNTQVNINDGAQLTVTNTDITQGIDLHALNDVIAKEKVVLKSGGALAGAGAGNSITETEFLADVTIGTGAALNSTGEVNISARGKGEVEATISVDTYGAATVAAANARATLSPENYVTIGTNADINADGDVNLSVGTDTEFNRDDYKVHAVADSFAGSVIPIDDINATATLFQNNIITVNSGADVKSARQMNLHAERFGFADMFAKAKAVNWASELGGTEAFDGDVDSGATGNVIVNGNLETGTKRNQSIEFNALGNDGTVSDYTATDGVTFSDGSGLISSSLFTALDEAERQLEVFNDGDPNNDTDLEAFYKGEINRIEQELLAKGLLEEVEINGVPQGIYVRNEVTVPIITVHDIHAEAGRIDVRADSLSTNGTITAPGDASVNIINHTTASLNINDITIPQENGGLYLNGELQGAEANVDDPSIVIVNDADIALLKLQGGNNANLTWPSISIYGDITNRSGSLTIKSLAGTPLPGTAEADETLGEGDINVYADLDVKDLIQKTKGSLVVDLPPGSTYSVGGSEYAKWNAEIGNNGLQEGTDTNANNEIYRSINTPNIYADRISIDAEFINVNGKIQSGREVYELVISAAVEDEINGIKQSGRGGYVKLSASTEDFSVYYDVANDRILVGELRVSGGYVSLTGHILNTNQNSNIEVLGGYGEIKVTNNTSLDIALQGLDASTRGAGILIINDKAKGTSADPFTTIYEKTAAGVRIISESGTTTGSNNMTYQPDTGGWRYAWSVGQESFERIYRTIGTSSWLGIDAFAKDPDTVTFVGTPEKVGTPVLQGQGAYFYKDSTNISDPYIYDSDKITLTSETSLVKKWTTSTWYGKKTYYSKFVKEDKVQDISTHSIKADYGISINFTGKETGKVQVFSQYGGDVEILGNISNETGLTQIVTNGSITTSQNSTVGGQTLTLSAASIGGGAILNDDGTVSTELNELTALRTNLTNNATSSLSAYTSGGRINIAELDGSLNINEIISASAYDKLNDTGGQVFLSSKGGIASVGSGLIQAGIINIATEGAVGSSAAAVNLDSGREVKDYVTVSANGDINLTEKDNGLRLREATSTAGDVTITITAGSLVDANDSAVRDERTYAELSTGLWEDLGLIKGSAAANAKIQETLDAFANSREQEYQAYWDIRNNQFAGAYDASQQATLSTEETTFYTEYYTELGTSNGLSGAALTSYVDDALQTLANKRTAEYHTLHTSYGADPYDAGFTYTLTTAEETALTDSIRLWEEDELLNLISAGLLKPVTDTQATIEDENITAAGTVTVNVLSGSVGEATGTTFIDADGDYTDDERVALAAAERPDVFFMSGEKSENVVVTFVDGGASADTMTRASGSWVTDGFVAGMQIRVDGNSANASEEGSFFEIASVTDTVITLVSTDTLSSEVGMTVTVSAILNNPTATTFIRTDAGAWADDGLIKGSYVLENGTYYLISRISGKVIDAEEVDASSLGSATTTDITATGKTTAAVQTIGIDQREDIDIDALEEISFSATGNIYIGSEKDIRVKSVAAGDAVRIKSAKSLINEADAGVAAVTGGNLVLEAADGTIGSSTDKFLIDLQADALLTARASGDIYVVEKDGNINVATIYSQSGLVYLDAQAGSIVDGLNHEYENIRAANITLFALAGGIGETGDYLDIDLTSGNINANTRDSIRLSETLQDMNVDHIESTAGDVDLRAHMSIVDAVDDLASEVADVIGGSIILTSQFNTVGEVGNDLQIDTGSQTGDNLTISSFANSYVIEMVGDLYLNEVAAGAAATAFIAAPVGRILNDNQTGDNVVSGKAYLFAAQDIGESDNALATRVGNIEGQSTTGSTWIVNTGAMAVGGVVDGSDPGMQAGGSVNLTTNSPLTVAENITANGNIILTSNDNSAGDDLTVNANITVTSQTGSITVNAGDDFIHNDGAKLDAATTIVINGDASSSDAEGSTIQVDGDLVAGTSITVRGNADDDTINVTGNVTAPTILIDGEAGEDVILLDLDDDSLLTGDTRIEGGADNDQITINELHSRSDKLVLDGEAGTDRYTINRTANDADYIIDVEDTGARDSGADTLTINGTADADAFLLRANFVAALHGDMDAGFSNNVERINYNENINARLTINGHAGNDGFYSDDNSSITTLDGGAGDDTFQIGQLYGADRQAPFVAVGDEIETTETTLGFLSNGNSLPMIVYGGDGEDQITVYSNKALTKLYGENDDDSFVVRAFLKKGTTETAGGGETELFGGDGADNIQYSINAPLKIDGGAGNDTLVVLGTEADDNFMITEDGIFGAGLNIGFEGIEFAEVDGLEGDDNFYILSTSEDVVTTIIGGLGSDTFSVAGDVTEDIVSYSVEGRSGFINHSVWSDDPRFNGIFVDGVSLNVADDETGKIQVDSVDGSLVVDENGLLSDFYEVSLAAAKPTAATIAYVTVSAARASSSDKELPTVGGGDPADSILVSTDNINFYESLVLNFDSEAAGGSVDDWLRKQKIYVKAVDDGAIEGERTVVINHSVLSDNPDFNELDINNVEVTVYDNDQADLIITPSDVDTRVVEGAASGDSFTVALTQQPADGETVTVVLAEKNAAGEIGFNKTVLTFDKDNWNSAQTVTVTAVDDADVENLFRTAVTFTTSSDQGGSGFNTVTTEELDVNVVDNDTGTVIVTPTNGSTIVSNGETDNYSLVLSTEPTDPVTVNVLTDGQTLVSSTDPRFNAADGTVTFTAADWDSPVEVVVAVNPAYIPDASNQPVQNPPLQPHTLDQIRGKLVIEGSVPPGKERALAKAVMLPTETDEELPTVDITTDEAAQTDTLYLFNDGSRSADTGFLTDSTITGLGMGTDGVHYNDVEVVEVLNGQGNDNFTVQSTAEGVITVIHGGGGSDTITVTGGGGASSPLILLGDSVQDGSTYTSTSDVKTDKAREFDTPNNYNDTINASGASGSVVIYGGQGNDTLTGSNYGDHIAGGSGNDEIYGLGGDDHIYGDAGFNLDLTKRLSLSTQVLSVVNTADAVNDNPETSDALTVGVDTIDGGSGNDIIFGDKGVIDQVTDTNRILTTGAVVSVTTTNRDEVANDILKGGADDDIIMGGHGQDDIEGGSGADILIGDHAVVDYNDGDTDITTLDSITTVELVNGDNDTIKGNEGDDLIMGGIGADNLFGGNGDAGAAIVVSDDDIIFGDHATALLANNRFVRLLTKEQTEGQADLIKGNEGSDRIFGGAGADDIFGDAGGDWIMGDFGEMKLYSNGNVETFFSVDEAGDATAADIIDGGEGHNRVIAGLGEDNITTGSGDDHIIGDNGVLNYGTDEVITEAYTVEHELGDDDTIESGSGDDIVLGGKGNDTISVSAGNDSVIGDNGRITFNLGIRDTLESTDTTNDTGGDDNISLGSGDDQAIAGVGNDTVTNESGETIIIGDDGFIQNDESGRYLNAYTDDFTLGGDDNLTGGDDRDIIFGGFGKDELDGGAGDDLMTGDSGMVTRNPSTIVLESKDLEEINDLDGDDDILRGGEGLDRMIGGAGGDLFYGSFSEDVMVGEYARYTFAADAETSGEQATFVITLAQGGLDLIRSSQIGLYKSIAQQIFDQSALGEVARSRTAVSTELTDDALAALGRLVDLQNLSGTAAPGVDVVIQFDPTAAGDETEEAEQVEGAVPAEGETNAEQQECIPVEGEVVEGAEGEEQPQECVAPEANTENDADAESADTQEASPAEGESSDKTEDKDESANIADNLEAALAGFSGWAVMKANKTGKQKANSKVSDESLNQIKARNRKSAYMSWEDIQK
ncbi:type I secretion target repeat protein [Oceanospirillum sp. MED92]|uniref:Type I secretion target repeat protein n=2 Tax=Neptuniibacter caesariensis TaxID=207954 RepID=A0A7U8C2D5_NEPCE|nr:type I secretion target repeat protein [Oceanospirillum sp. MED92] [Neptuniibacter caesariensis]